MGEGISLHLHLNAKIFFYIDVFETKALRRICTAVPKVSSVLMFETFGVLIPRGKHPFPFRIRPLSPSGPMVVCS